MSPIVTYGNGGTAVLTTHKSDLPPSYRKGKCKLRLDYDGRKDDFNSTDEKILLDVVYRWKGKVRIVPVGDFKKCSRFIDSPANCMNNCPAYSVATTQTVTESKENKKLEETEMQFDFAVESFSRPSGRANDFGLDTEEE